MRIRRPSARVLPAILACTALCGCAGSGGTATPPAASPAHVWKNSAQVTLAFAAPASQARREPSYVSPSSRSMRVTVNSVDGAAPPAWVTPNPSIVNFATSGSSANCTVSGGTQTCTISVPGPPGNVSYTFDLFDAANASGAELGTVTQTVTIAQGQTTPIDVTISGIAAAVTVSAGALTPSTALAGSPSFERLSVAVKDADGNVITDSSPQPLANPVQLTISDALHATSLSASDTASCPGTASVTLASAQQPVWLCYTGEATTQVTISANVGGGGTVPVTLNPIVLENTAICSASAGCSASDPNYDAATLFFASTNGSAATRTLSASELGWTQAPYDGEFDLTLDPATCAAPGGPVISTPANPADSWTLTALNPGVCKGTLTEHAAVPLRTSGTAVWFSVTDGSVTGF